MHAEIVYDATEFIEASIWEVGKTIPEAVVIVVVVILLFLGSFRAVVIPVVTIPLSLIGVLFWMQQAGVVLGREPARIPGPVDADPKADRIDFLTHYAVSRSRTMTVRFDQSFSMRDARPRARAWNRFMTICRPT